MLALGSLDERLPWSTNTRYVARPRLNLSAIIFVCIIGWFRVLEVDSL